MESRNSSASNGHHNSAFAVTQWSIVQRAGQSDSPEADAALDKLCQTYWQPLHAYILRRGVDADEAKDLTQSFFESLISKRTLAAVDPRKGKFRSFLLACLKNFLKNDWRNRHTDRKGRDFTFVPFDPDFEPAPAVLNEAEKHFEQQWAITLLNDVLARLESEYTAEGRADLYRDLKDALAGERTGVSYAEIAQRRDMTEAAVKMTVYRMRKRYGELLIAQISETVSTPEEVEDELRALFAALS